MNIQNANLTFKGSMANRSKTNRIILHHAEASSCTPQQIHQWHLNNGWSGAGYHFLVRKDGSVYSLRPENKIGSHAKNNNSDSIGICFEGKYMTETMPEAQKKAGKELVAYLKSKYGISKVQAHRDVCSTDCPGSKFPFNEIANVSAGSSNVTTKPSTPTTAPSTKPSTGSTGAVGNWIAKLQTECNAQGFSKQKVDGIAGPNTLAGCPTLKKGSKGTITKIMQQRLIDLGYSCGSYGADGTNGAGTQEAIKRFQRDKGLTADGIVGPNTWRKLLGL